MSNFYNDLIQTPRGKKIVLFSVIAAILIGGGLFVFSNFYTLNGIVEVESPNTKAQSTFTLTLTKSNIGTVSGYNISCGPGCSQTSQTYPQGTELYIFADCRNNFIEWSGDCSDSNRTNDRCFLTMNSDKTVGAVITPSLDDEWKKSCDANGIRAYFDQGQEIKNAVGVRYKFRINKNLANRPEWGKIIFNGLAFHNPDSGKGWGYFLETNIYNYHSTYQDQVSCSDTPDVWRNAIPGEGGYFVSGSDYHSFPECFDGIDNDGDGKTDYPNDSGCSSLLDNDERNNPPVPIPLWDNGRVGLRPMNTVTQQMFPRGLLPRNEGFTKIESMSIMNINEKDVYAEIMRGDKFTVTEPIEGWGFRYVSDLSKVDLENPRREDFAYRCESKLPAGEYRTWKVKAVIDGVTYAWEYAFPETHAKYIHPQIKDFFTEFFNNPGFFQVYLWDIEVLKDETGNWLPLTKWRSGSSWFGPNDGTQGFRLATYNNHPVIETSNDGTDNYYKFDDIFELPINSVVPSATISASPNPCDIVPPATMCSSTIAWETTNAPNSCIFLKESKRVFACGSSGSSVAPWITEQGVTFELREESNINSQLLASVFVKGIKQTIVQYFLNVSKSGTGIGTITASGINCGSDCGEQETYNQGALVALTAAPNSDSLFVNWSGDCSGTSPTCNLTMNSNKTVTAVFNKKPTDTVVCSSGSVRACIDSISPNPVNKGQTITFQGHGEADDNKPIQKYRWRLDSISGKSRICKQGENTACQFDSGSISSGTHTVYFRVSVGRFLGGWSEWISREFTVLSSSNSSSSSSNNSLSSLSSSSLSVPSTNIPVAPVDLTITLGGKPSPNTRTLFLRWKDMSSNEDKFEIEWKFTKQAFSSKWIRVNLPANQDNYSFNALVEKGITYYFRVRACNNTGCSAYVESNYAF